MIKTIYRFRPPQLLNTVQKRTSFYNKYRHGPTAISNPKPPYAQWLKEFFSKKGIEAMKDEAKRIAKKPFTAGKFRKIHNDFELVKFEDFDSDKSIKRWKPVADSDSFNGFSIATITRSPAGHALFKGILDNRLPEDGLTDKSGFAGIIGPQKPRDKSFQKENFWTWSEFDAVEIKFRGDGRKYSVILNTGTYSSDLEYYDAYGYPLYTRGGPYWQTLTIPFRKFIFMHKGKVQDRQNLWGRNFFVKFVAITLEDTYDGPFELEIDYIGLKVNPYPFDEHTPYESYTFPHLKFKALSVGCDPPEQGE